MISDLSTAISRKRCKIGGKLVLLERLVVRQLIEYLSSTDLIPPLQSGYRQGHSTETAVLRVLSDILLAVDNGDLAALVLLDMSAAFDTVDHSILQLTFGIYDTAHGCFQSYLSSRKQYTYAAAPASRRSPIWSAVCPKDPS